MTGGAQGIGFGIARCFAEEGAAVVIADIKEQAARGAAAMHSAGGAAASGFGVDIGDDASVAAPGAFIEEKHGRCEILVNNAAIADGTGIEAMTMQRYHEVIRVNQDGAIRVTLALVPLLKKGGEGRRILNIASIMGVRGWPDAIPRSTAKGAIVNFTRALACDLAPHGIMVNALAPGFVDTPMSILLRVAAAIGRDDALGRDAVDAGIAVVAGIGVARGVMGEAQQESAFDLGDLLADRVGDAHAVELPGLAAGIDLLVQSQATASG